MEKFRRKLSHARVSSPNKVVTIVDRSFNDQLITIERKGNQVSRKHNNFPKLASDSSSCSSGLTEEDNLFTFDLERSYSSLPTGTPMKKLLADEIMESKRRSPSVIARLMGLDGLPVAQNTNKQQKQVSYNHQQNAFSSGSCKSSKLWSRRKNSKGQQHFKVVDEIPECSNSHGAFNPNPSEDEISFVKQKFMDVKRFSTDERLQHSKEFHDALDVLDSNKDLLLKFLQEPDSLFAKHLHDLHGVDESHCGRPASMKSTNTLKCNIDAIGCQSGGESSRKIDISHSHKHRDRHGINSHKLNFPAEGKEDSTSIPTRIVVLKPNLGKVQNTDRSILSPSPSCDHVSRVELHNKCSNIVHTESEMRGKRSKHIDSENYGNKSRESRELAREITRRMRNKLDKGYSADESSREVSENDSPYESEVTFVSSHTSFNRSDRNKTSSSHYTESSVNREAKKRLSERWKMTHRSQEIGPCSNGSTLAEMLAVPDVDIRPRNADADVAQDECFHTFGTSAPLGISSRDGWKDGCIRNLSRSRSLPSSSNHLGSPKSGSRRETLATERFLVWKDSIGHGRSMAIKRDSKRKEESFSESTRPCHKKSQSSYSVSMEMIDDTQEVQFSGNFVTKSPKSLDEKDSPEVKNVILEMSSCRRDTSLALNAAVDKEHKSLSESVNCPDELVPTPHIPSNALSQDDFSTCDTPCIQQEPSITYDTGSSSGLQCGATQPGSPVSSKESEQPSPVSVLEPPFVEDNSSGSECFERVSAELHGLRMQLQLLKLESEAYDEGSILISSDEDEEEAMELHDEKGFNRAGESWQSSYLVDILNESGLDETDNLDLFLETWHSPDCPIGPWVFENLEKKYCEYESCSRSARRLLFDTINFKILEVSQKFFDLQPWVNPITRNVGPKRWKGGFKTELHKLLENHEKKAVENVIDVVMLGNVRWLELGDHIDAIGNEIEGLLIDELVTEVFPV